jgi:hypothetical protein
MLMIATGSPAGVVVTEAVPTVHRVTVPPSWLPGLFAFDPRERVYAHIDQQRVLLLQWDQVPAVDERWRRLPA